jgi:ribosomal protein S16
MKEGRVEHWVKNGALPSNTVATLLKAASKPAKPVKAAA